MDADLVVIFSFIVLIAMIVFGSGHAIHKRNIAHEERKLELEARKAEAERGTPDGTVRKLEERVRVLERLATDRPGMESAALADQIESLRADAPKLAEPNNMENAR